MPKETNLNLSPYFDDFDSSKNYYSVLFKPGYPVQSRELTTLQTILQNQIEQFGNHIFKEGSVVIPGQINYNNNFFAIEVEPDFLGINVVLYANALIGKNIKGQSSNVTGKIVSFLDESLNRNTVTFFINYINSGENNVEVFEDSEILILEDSINFNGIIISSGQGFAITISNNSSTIGSAVVLSEGVYFIRGYFVNVYNQLLILDPHNNTPSYKVGLEISEQIITADEDDSLSDNARGFNNYTAPGADRFKIIATLVKKSPNNTNYPNFIELLEIKNGEIVNFKKDTNYNLIGDELARRTYDESGNYYVNPFKVSVNETLNNLKGNNGIFLENQVTYNNNVPSKDLATYQISPGKAFIKGYEVATTQTTFLDFDKPRTTKTLENQSINYFTGSTLKLNRVYGSPNLSISSPSIISLRDSRVSSQTSSSGKEIGVCRVYDFALESGSYDTQYPDSNVWDISLYDIQTYAELNLNENITLSVPTRIEGNSSGAVGFLRYNSINSGIVTVYNIKGNFINGESISFDSLDQTRVSVAISSFSISDVKSLYGIVGSASTFTANVIQTNSINVGSVNITKLSTVLGISTVTSSTFNFDGKVKLGSIVSYSNPGNTLPSLAKVVSVGNRSIEVSAVSSITGVSVGSLPTSNITPSDFKILSTNFIDSIDNALYTKLPKSTISNVNLINSSITTRKQFSISITNGSTGVITADTDETFLPFDEERYILTRSNGENEILTEDKFNFSSGSQQLEIKGLGSSDPGAKLIATLRKINLKAKIKNKIKIKSIIIDKSIKSSSGIGSTTLNDGLTYGKYPYGTRVQDKEICLQNPDVVKIHGIVESSGTSDPELPKLDLSSLSGPSSRTTDLLIGEEFYGETSNCIAIYAERTNDLRIGLIYLNDKNFQIGEKIIFKESGITATIDDIKQGDNFITNNYTFDNGQNQSIYDYSKIIRNTSSLSPSKKIKIIYEYLDFSDSDSGDFITKNSYEQYDLCDIPRLQDNTLVSDLIDIRPRVSEYIPSIGSRSPFEFYGRSFNANGSAKNILASDESINLSFSYYLPRFDKLYLSRFGTFEIVKGEPSDSPQLPPSIDESLLVCDVFLPAYLCNLSDVKISLAQHKRYQMKDIYTLEERIKNLEYYSTLSILESKTQSLVVTDASGLNRFKSGFLVDNFTTKSIQNKKISQKNSIDSKNRELRPSHYTTQLDLLLGSNSIIGIGTTSNPLSDLRFASDIVGNGIRRTGQIITLDYENVVEIMQPFATRFESVTPFLITTYSGTIELNPSSDIWVDTVRATANVTEIDNFTPVQQQLVEIEGFDPQTGFGPISWNSWETVWSGSRVTASGRTFVTTQTTTNQVRTGERTILTENVETISQGDRVIDISTSLFMRSRNIEFISKRNRPLTQLYPFFDGRNVFDYTFPKLLEIRMSSGSFVPGETVQAFMLFPGNRTSLSASFRLCNSNHKYGPILNPTDVYTTNPYDRNSVIPASYSATSTILNIDTFSLASQPLGNYFGVVAPKLKLRGLTSRAEAEVTNVRLITDNVGTLIGSFFIPNPNIPTNPKFEVGEKTFKLTSSDTNSDLIGPSGSVSQTTYRASGTIETIQEQIVSVRSPSFSSMQVGDSRTLTSIQTQRRDPLAQTFTVSNQGCFVTKIDVYFKSKDANVPVIAQLRTTSLGTPTETVIPFSEVVLNSSEIKTSNDASLATTITFPSPIYLSGQTDYALVLMSDSTEHSVWISRLGEIDITTLSGPESQQIVVTQQPNLGSLFKSQNGATWTPSQYEDLKFTIYRSNFTSNTGEINFYNPDLGVGNKQILNLKKDALEFYSKTIRVGLGTTVQDSGLKLGNTIYQQSTNASGNYVGFAGSAFGNLGIVNSGIGYTPSSGSLTYNNVNIIPVTGSGRNASINITINNGEATSATIVNGGTGYKIGDIVTVSSLGSNSLGRNIRLSISQLSGINELILDNVQGDFETGSGKYLKYVNSSNNLVTLNTSVGGNVLISDIILYDQKNDGLHVKVNHKNHGMNSPFNIVNISDVSSDIPAAKLSSTYSSTSNGDILLDDASNFSTFENIIVSPSYPGYILIDKEIISYTGKNGNYLTGITRGIDQTYSYNYNSGTFVYKYENCNVSLRRINKNHNLNDVSIKESIGLDYYFIKLNMSTSGYNRSVGTVHPKLYINESKSTGKDLIYASQNIPFEIINPIVQTMIPQKTKIISSVRTISGSSINGVESPFQDLGYQNINLNENNYFNSPRIIASKVNENEKLSNSLFPGRKSFTLNLNLSTSDPYLSPVIDLDRVGVILTSNRINSVILDYINDSRVSSLDNDPSEFIYATKPTELEISATSLKVLISAHINVYGDIRAFYAISNNLETDMIYYPFPGYTNINTSGEIIDISKNSGLPDVLIPKTDKLGYKTQDVPYKEYEFNIDNLPSFKFYSIKILGTSTNQSYPPRIKDFRVISLA